VITVIAKLQAGEGKADELRAVLEEMIANVKQHEAGQAVTYSLHTTSEDASLFMFYEQYASEAAFAAHGQTDHMKAFGAKLGGLIGGRPVIERYTQIAGV